VSEIKIKDIFEHSNGRPSNGMMKHRPGPQRTSGAVQCGVSSDPTVRW